MTYKIFTLVNGQKVDAAAEIVAAVNAALDILPEFCLAVPIDVTGHTADDAAAVASLTNHVRQAVTAAIGQHTLFCMDALAQGIKMKNVKAGVEKRDADSPNMLAIGANWTEFERDIESRNFLLRVARMHDAILPSWKSSRGGGFVLIRNSAQGALKVLSSKVLSRENLAAYF